MASNDRPPGLHVVWKTELSSIIPMQTFSSGGSQFTDSMTSTGNHGTQSSEIVTGTETSSNEKRSWNAQMILSFGVHPLLVFTSCIRQSNCDYIRRRWNPRLF